MPIRNRTSQRGEFEKCRGRTRFEKESPYSSPLQHTFHPSRLNSQGHMSFSTGEKNCIGWKMAETEAKVLLSTFLKSFRVEPVSEITSILELVARPAVLGEESKGSQLPLRLIRRE